MQQIASEEVREAIITLDSQKDYYQQKYEQSDSENKILREKIKLMRLNQFGKSSEKYCAEDLGEQKCLFESEEIPFQATEKIPKKIKVKEHERKKSGRHPLPEELPREEIIHDLPESERIDSHGRLMKEISRIISEKLRYTPAKFIVERHIRIKYASIVNGLSDEDAEIKTAPMPPQLLPKTIATDSLVSQILVSKFADGLPFYRQEKQFDRLGIDLSRATMCNWTLALWEQSKPVEELLLEELLKADKIHMDETSIQVICENEGEKKGKSYMFVARGGPPGKPVICFRYSYYRNRAMVKKFLGDYQGIVQTDGHQIYDYLDLISEIIHAGCWTHGRRGFRKIVDISASGKTVSQAKIILDWIQDLYDIERYADDLKMSAEDRLNLRKEKSVPIVNNIETLLKHLRPLTGKASMLGKAITYMSNQWDRLVLFLKDGRILLDNNLAENAIRPFVVGRKNWLFNFTQDGARASGFFYSLIETAKACGYEPCSYLNYYFKRLPHAVTEDDFKMLLPQYADPSEIQHLKKN